MVTTISFFGPEYEFRYESDWHANSLLSFAQQIWSDLGSETRTEQAVRALVAKFLEAAGAYYRRGIALLESSGSRNTPYERHRLIEQIGEEWSHVMSLVSTSRLLPATDQTLKALGYVINRAWRDLNLDESCQVAVLPHFGRHFELVTFHYAPEIVMVGIPLPSLYCPWDWTMIWHEVAGIYIQTRAGRESGEALLGEMEELPEEVWQNWRNSYPQEMELLLLEGSHMPGQEILRNWAEELVEDGVAVLCLGDTMAEGLSRILERHYTSDDDADSEGTRDTLDQPPTNAPATGSTPAAPSGDDEEAGETVEVSVDRRHPPAGLRVQVAMSLSHQMGLRDPDSQDEGARRLARVILSNWKKLVGRKFSLTDKEEIGRVVAALLAGQSPNQAGSIDAYVLIPAALQAFWHSEETERKAIGEHIQRVVHDRLKRHLAPGPGLVRLGLSSFQEELLGVTAWEDLLNLAFSEIDEGTATESGSHKHTGLFGRGTLRIRFSGVSTDHGPHSGAASHRHSH